MLRSFISSNKWLLSALQQTKLGYPGLKVLSVVYTRFLGFHKMSGENVDLFYNTVLNLTEQAGKIIKENISSRHKNINFKSSNIDMVTETDQAVEKLFIDSLSKEFPDHKFIGEESSSTDQQELTNDPTWVIDPVDGTMNFVHTFPHSCISIALFIEKEPVIGIIFNPMLSQLFTARKGQGAFLNGERISVSDKTSLSDALIMMEFGTSRHPERLRNCLENQQKLMPHVHGLRALGSAALDMAMVACGAADAYFEFGIHIWDIAAGELIVREAGGVIIDPAGGKIERFSRRVLVASSQELAEKLSQQLTQLYPLELEK
ncbi:unnamed protein product [Phaedon cochleariae]|uniref:Inositol-1-monophosphatase n=1 Tax=Phaedon cochleariae TaxID=80249 RepID=A0A9P0GRM4_PHACE|nr:unnamed protein product [Phaedon cochleariae]